MTVGLCTWFPPQTVGDLGEFAGRFLSSIPALILPAFACLTLSTWTQDALAGPPYVTDDPEPVAYRHWEIYLASLGEHDRDGWSGTAPHVEVNYGPVRNVQLHVIVPLAYASSGTAHWNYGPGDTELGVKFRFVQEGELVPQIGTFPFLEVPTGSASAGLGSGTAQVFLPIWVQKSYRAWTTYGGGGYWFDVGSPHQHWWYWGWQVQCKVIDGFTPGVELFHLTPRERGTQRDTRFNLGGVIDLTDHHHLLVSAGRGFAGPVVFQYYAAYQLTLGPDE